MLTGKIHTDTDTNVHTNIHSYVVYWLGYTRR